MSSTVVRHMIFKTENDSVKIPHDSVQSSLGLHSNYISEKFSDL